MIKKIIFRADGNSKIGLGHLYRILAIVEFYKQFYEPIFVLKETTLVSILPTQYEKIVIPEKISINEEPTWLSKEFDPSKYIIVADGYQFVSSYQKKIKNLGFTLIYIDDLATEHMYADVVVNHSPYCKVEHFNFENYTRFGLGTKYAILRPVFNKAAHIEREIKEIKNVFVCFGGADMYNLSIRAAQALLNIDKIKEIHIVLGAAYKHKEILTLENNNDKVRLYRNLDEESLYNLIKSCQMAIVPSSNILYEVCSVKMPVLSGYYVENQKNIYKGLVEKDVIVEGGDFTNYTILDFEEKVKFLLESNRRTEYISNQHELFDGKSKQRFLGLINQLNISFRRANEKDVLETYNWSNDELVRKNSYNSKPIKLEEHKVWFLKKINDKRTIFLIALVNNRPAGVVRYQIEEKNSIVGVLVSKEYRGQKLATEFLKKSAKEYFKKNSIPVLAYIKKDNIASIKTFENSRYVYFKDENIKGIISFVYKLEKRDVKR